MSTTSLFARFLLVTALCPPGWGAVASPQHVAEAWRFTDLPTDQHSLDNCRADGEGGVACAFVSGGMGLSPAVLQVYRIDASGDLAWRAAVPLDDDFAELHGVGLDREGILAAGLFEQGGYRLVRFDPAGSVLSDAFVPPPSPAGEYRTSVAARERAAVQCTPDGDVVALMGTDVPSSRALYLRFDGSGALEHRVELFGRSEGHYRLAAPVDEDVTVVSRDSSPLAVLRRVERFDPSGALRWAFTTPDPDVGTSRGFASNRAGDVVLGVRSPGNAAATIYVVDASGDLVLRFDGATPGSAVGDAYHLALNEDRFVFAGDASGTSGIDGSGRLVWSGDYTSYLTRFLGVDDRGNVVVAGAPPLGAAIGVFALKPSGLLAWVAPARLGEPEVALGNSGCVGSGGAVFVRGVEFDGSGATLGQFALSKIYGDARIDFDACITGAINSTGRVGGLEVHGSSDPTADDVTLVGTELPPGAFGFFLCSTALLPLPIDVPGSRARLCLGSPTGRLVGPGQVRRAGPGGRVALALDLDRLPQPAGTVAVAPGDTWYFQGWYRDQEGALAISRTTDAVGIRF
ncbi:MAG: hypothetical protein AAFZ87_04130 [Planctomycetota bacterium]